MKSWFKYIGWSVVLLVLIANTLIFALAEYRQWKQYREDSLKFCYGRTENLVENSGATDVDDYMETCFRAMYQKLF